MKRLDLTLLYLATALLLGFLLTACGGDEENGPGDMADEVEMIEACPSEGAMIAAAPLVFEFGPIQAGATQQRDLSINNGGTGQACFDDPIVTLEPADAPFDIGPLIVGGEAASALNPGQTGTISFTFSPTAAVEDGVAQVTIASSNGNTASVTLRYDATGSAATPIGSVGVDATIPFILDATQADNAMYRDNSGGVVEEAVITGTFDDAAVPTTGSTVRAWAVREPTGGPDGPYIELWQQEYEMTPFEAPLVDPGFSIVFPNDMLMTGTQPLSLTADRNSIVFVSTGTNPDGTTCASGIGTGSLTISNPMDTTAVDGGSFSVTGNVTIFPASATPEGDATGGLAGLGFPECEGGPVAGPVYIRIDDVGMAGDSEDSGADIDAIGVFKNGESYWAEEVISFVHGGGFTLELDPLNALGPPDSFLNWPDLGTCNVDSGFVSLGGSGGQLIVKMPVAIQEGDSVQILEVGNCDFGGGTAIADPTQVFVSKAPDDSVEWIPIGSPTGGAETLTVPALDFGQ